MNKLLFSISLMAAMLLGTAINTHADYTPVLVSPSEIKAGMKLYLECGPTAYNGKYMVAHPETNGANAVMCDEALADVGTAAQWVFEAASGTDPIYTGKPLYYLKDVTTGKYYGAASSTTSINQKDKRMVEGTTLAYTFCILTASEIKAKEDHNLDVYGNDKAIFIQHTNADGSWFRLSRFGSYTQVFYINSTGSYPDYKTTTGWQAWNAYAAEEPNSAKAAEGIAALQAYYDEVAPYYALMTDPTYDDAALTEAHLGALSQALAAAKTALDDTPSGENAYYTDLKDQLQAVYEQVPYVAGGKKYWAISVNDLTDGSKVIFERGARNATNYKDPLYMVANTGATGNNAVLTNADSKNATAVWQLEATGNYDKIYTDKPTYYLKDVTSGKYFGTTDLTGTGSNKKNMVNTTAMAYPFCFLSIEDVKNKQGITVGAYGNPDAAIIQYSIDSENWLRPVSFGAYTYVYMFDSYNTNTSYTTNTMWPAWNLYTGEQNLSIQDELTEVMAEYGSKTFPNTGSDPGCFDESKVQPYTDALAAVNALTATSTRQQIRTAIDNLISAYEAVKNLEVLPITDDYYYIESAWSSLAGTNTRACDPNDGSNLVQRKSYSEPDKYAIWQIKETATGQYTIQNLGSQLYIGNQIDNNVTLVSDVPTATYQMFTYDAEGQFKWKDSGTNFTYYIKTYGDNAVGRYYPQGTSGFDAWYLKRVPTAVIADFLGGDYTYNDGVISTDSEVDLTILKAVIDSKEPVTAVDLTAATLPTGTTADQLSALVSGTNALVYINDGSLQGTNIVSGSYCQELRLIDKTDFAPMEETLAAGSATITRKLYPGLNTVCVPLNIAADNIPIEGAKLYTYRGEDNGTLNFTEVTTVEAGTPCLVELPAGTATTEYDLTFNELAAIANAPATTFQIMGTYTNKTLGEGYYKLSEDDTFVKTTAASTIKAFRFYLDLIGAGSNTFKISLSSDDDPTAITAIQNADEDIIAIYSADGIKRTSLQKGLNIIRYANGNIQKILIK